MSVASLTTDSLKFDEIVEWGAASDRKTYAAMYCDFANTDLRERIRSIAVPVLVLLEPHFKNIVEFEAIYREYWSKVFRLCMGYVNDYGLAQDMAQETFVAVWQKLSSFRNEAAVGTWIFRIATNRCLRQLERQSRMVPVTLSTDLPEEERTGIGLRLRLLYKLIAELPEMDRILISLELEDVRQAEIARITGLSEGNVRVRIHRIKALLTKKIRAYEE